MNSDIKESKGALIYGFCAQFIMKATKNRTSKADPFIHPFTIHQRRFIHRCTLPACCSVQYVHHVTKGTWTPDRSTFCRLSAITFRIYFGKRHSSHQYDDTCRKVTCFDGYRRRRPEKNMKQALKSECRWSSRVQINYLKDFRPFKEARLSQPTVARSVERGWIEHERLTCFISLRQDVMATLVTH